MDVKEIATMMMRGPVEVMDKQTTDLFLTFCLSEQKITKEKNQELLGHTYKILKGRSLTKEGEISETVFAFLTFLSNGNAGTAVLWAAFLNAMVKKHSKVDMDRIAHCFPMGFPTDEALSKVWDAQKTELGANSVDLAFNWE